MASELTNAAQQSDAAPKQAVPLSRLPTPSLIPHLSSRTTMSTPGTGIPRPRERRMSSGSNRSSLSAVNSSSFKDGIFKSDESDDSLSKDRLIKFNEKDKQLVDQSHNSAAVFLSTPILSRSSSTSARYPRTDTNLTEVRRNFGTPRSHVPSVDRLLIPPESTLVLRRDEETQRISLLEKQLIDLRAQLTKYEDKISQMESQTIKSIMDAQLRSEDEQMSDQQMREEFDREKSELEVQIAASNKNMDVTKKLYEELEVSTTSKIAKMEAAMEEQKLVAARHLEDLNRQREVELMELRAAHERVVNELQVELQRVSSELKLKAKNSAKINESMLQTERDGKASGILQTQLDVTQVMLDQGAFDINGNIVAHLNAEIEVLRRDLASRDERIDQHQMDMARATASCSVFEDTFEELNEIIKNSQQQKDTADMEIYNLRTVIDELQSMVGHLKAEKEELLTQINQTTETKDAIEKELGFIREDLNVKFQILAENEDVSLKLKTSLDLNAQNAGLMEELSAKSGKILELEEVITNLRSEIEAAHSKIENSTTTEVVLSQSLERAREEHTELLRDFERTSQQQRQLEEEIQTLRLTSVDNAIVDKLHSTIADLKSRTIDLEEEVKNKIEALDICNESLEDIERTLSERENTNRELNLQVAELSKLNEETTVAVETKKIRILELEDMIEGFKLDADALKREVKYRLDNLKTVDKASSDGALQFRNTELEECLNNFIGEIECFNGNNQRHIQELKQEIDNLQMQLVNSRSAAEQVALLEAELSDTLDQLNKSEEKIGNHMQETEALKVNIKNAEAERDELLNRLSKENESNVVLRSELSLLTRDVESQRIAMARQDEALKTLCFEFDEKSVQFGLELENFKRANDKFKVELSEANSKFALKEAELSNTTGQLAESDRLLRVYEGSIEELDRKTNKMKATLKENDTTIRELERKLNDNEALKSSMEQISALTSENAQLKDERDELRSLKDVQATRITILETNIGDLASSLDSCGCHVTGSENRFDTNDSEHLLKIIKKFIDHLLSELKNKEAMLEIIRKQSNDSLMEAQKEYETLSNKSVSHAADLLNDIDKLQSQLSAKETALDDMGMAINSRDTEILLLKEQLTTLRNQVETLEVNLENSRHKLEATLAGREQEVISLQNAQSTKAQMEEQFEATKEILLDVTQERDYLNREMVTTQATLEHHIQQYKILKQECAAAFEIRDALQIQVSSLEVELASTLDQKKTLAERISSAEESLKRMEQASNNAEQQIMKKLAEINSLKEELTTAHQKMIDVEKDLTDRDRQIQQHSRENSFMQRLEEQNTGLKQEIEKLILSNVDLNQKTFDQEKTLGNLREQLKELGDKVVMTEASLADTSLENERTDDKYMSILKENKWLNDRIELLKRQNKVLQIKLAEVQGHLGSGFTTQKERNSIFSPGNSKNPNTENMLNVAVRLSSASRVSPKRDIDSISQGGDEHSEKRQMIEKNSMVPSGRVGGYDMWIKNSSKKSDTFDGRIVDIPEPTLSPVVSPLQEVTNFRQTSPVNVLKKSSVFSSTNDESTSAYKYLELSAKASENDFNPAKSNRMLWIERDQATQGQHREENCAQQ